MLRTFKLKADDGVQSVEISVRMILEDGLTLHEANRKKETLQDDLFQHGLLPRYHVGNIKVVG